jgi:von Willebrand factor A domain-containing protein 7
VSVQVSTGSGCAWSAAGGDTWLTFTNQSGSGSGTITLTASPNTTGGTQTAFVTVANQDVAITQPATPCTYEVKPTQVSVPAGGGSGNLSVTTSCPVVASSSASWLTVVSLSSSVNYIAAPNLAPSQRSATITVGTQAVVVTQAGEGLPRLSGEVLSQSETGSVMTLSLQLSNTGTGPADNTIITAIQIRTLGGTGTVTESAPSLPLTVGNLAVGGSTTVTLTLSVPSTVTKFSVSEEGTLQDSEGTSYQYAIGQVVYP